MKNVKKISYVLLLVVFFFIMNKDIIFEKNENKKTEDK